MTVSFDLSTIISYYNARIASNVAGASTAASSTQSQSTGQTPPWYEASKSDTAQDKLALSTDEYFDSSDLNLFSAKSTTSSAGSMLEALMQSRLSGNSANAETSALSKDNDKLFALYNALTRLDRITDLATRDGALSGQLPGLNTRFQDGLAQIQSFVTDTAFSNLTVLTGTKTDKVTATAVVPSARVAYQGPTLVNEDTLTQPLAGLSASDQFTVSVTKGGVKTDVVIDLSQVSGPLTIDNVISYANQQLQAAGFGTRLKRVQTGGSLLDSTATFGLSVNPSGAENVSLSSAAAKPALYISGQGGTGDTAQGKLVKVSDLDGDADATFSRSITPDDGTATAKASAVDDDGNVYVVGNATGSFGSEINQGTQDVFLSKYDSAGNLQWTKLLGSAGAANGYAVALDSSGNVVVAGSTTGKLSSTAIGGNTDSFVAKYNSAGDQQWVRQTAPFGNDSALALTVADDGSIYVGGQTVGVIGSGQTNQGGADAYVTKLSAKGVVQYHRQFGTGGSDAVNATAMADDGNLVVASVQDGHAILTKYDSSTGSGAALWQVDLGDLAGGSLGTLVVAGDQIYLSGSTSNANLTASGAADIANASSGGADAFVFRMTDGGASATADSITYVGTGSTERGTGLAVGSDGTIYLSGTTGGTFAGQNRSVENTNNMFAAAIGDDGSLQWTRQFGGISGYSSGAALSLDEAGSSVLDVLGLPRGDIDFTASNEIASSTTVRAGDYFKLEITNANGTREAKITISKGETLRSLALKVSNALLFDGKATSSYVSGGHALKIAVNEGVTVKMVSGPADFDALAGLGIKPGYLIKDSADASATATTSEAGQSVGLGIDSAMNLLNKTDASHAHNVIQGALSLIKKAYQDLNNPTATTATTSGGTAPAYLTSQLASYQAALSLFGGS